MSARSGEKECACPPQGPVDWDVTMARRVGPPLRAVVKARTWYLAREAGIKSIAEQYAVVASPDELLVALRPERQTP